MQDPTSTKGTGNVQPDPENRAGTNRANPPAALQGEGARLTEAAGDGADLAPAAESDIWRGRTQWRHFSGRIGIWAMGSMAGLGILLRLSSQWTWMSTWMAFGLGVGVAVVLAILLLGRPFLAIFGRRYRLTSQRLFIEKGILSRTIDQTELIRVDDVRIYKSLLDRLFGLGTVVIRSTDASDAEIRIEGVADPDGVGETIRAQMRAMRGKSLFVESL
ncbi:MAG: PH domain-containing protein [Phycisphaerae bacterium]